MPWCWRFFFCCLSARHSVVRSVVAITYAQTHG
uniref:Uncharacterized protein n=1 Tax=Human herpesvirus 2 TaxID=10310 RepID=A0A481TFV7_HHV2|nr:hypothetical protein [Human alphaherpesvirus 2]